jgi:hypothetical protein
MRITRIGSDNFHFEIGHSWTPSSAFMFTLFACGYYVDTEYNDYEVWFSFCNFDIRLEYSKEVTL